MTVSANAVFNLSRDTLIRRAMQEAQLLNADKSPTGGEISMAADFLNMELQSLAAEGVTLYQKERTTQLLVVSTASYSLAADTIDVAVGPDGFAGTIIDSNNLETRVSAMSGHDYLLLADKTTESDRPTHVYVEKLETLALVFWPVPSAAYTFKYQKVRLIRDVDTGAVTLDVARRWQKYLWLELASKLARALSKPGELVADLRADAREAKKAALLSDREMMNGQFYVAPSSGGC
jgi:hypothetical protein